MTSFFTLRKTLLILLNEILQINGIISWYFLSWIMWVLLLCSVYIFGFEIPCLNLLFALLASTFTLWKLIRWIFFSLHIYASIVLYSHGLLRYVMEYDSITSCLLISYCCHVYISNITFSFQLTLAIGFGCFYWRMLM